MADKVIQQWFADLLNTAEARAEYLTLGLIAAFEERREKLGLTYTQIAERMGVSRAYVSKLMQGRQNSTVGSLVKLAEALECELSIGVRTKPAEADTHKSNGKRNGKVPAVPTAGRRRVG